MKRYGYRAEMSKSTSPQKKEKHGGLLPPFDNKLLVALT